MRTHIPFALLATALACSFFAAPAHALRARVFVSKTGADVGACSFSAPCQSLDYALSGVEPGGEITILDSAGYNPITITIGVTITVPPGVEAGIAVPSGGNAITINAGLRDKVTLRGLTLDGTALGATGIQFNTGASLTVQDSVIRNFTGDGLDFRAGGGLLSVSNTVVSDNGSAGIAVYPTDQYGATVTINRVETNNNFNYGVFLWGTPSTGGVIAATVSESMASHNGHGFAVITDASHSTTSLSLFHSVAAFNGAGFYADGQGAVITAAQSMGTENVVDWNATNNGIVRSFGDNYFDSPFGGLGAGLSSINKQ